MGAGSTLRLACCAPCQTSGTGGASGTGAASGGAPLPPLEEVPGVLPPPGAGLPATRGDLPPGTAGAAALGGVAGFSGSFRFRPRACNRQRAAASAGRYLGGG